MVPSVVEPFYMLLLRYLEFAGVGSRELGGEVGGIEIKNFFPTLFFALYWFVSLILMVNIITTETQSTQSQA